MGKLLSIEQVNQKVEHLGLKVLKYINRREQCLFVDSEGYIIYEYLDNVFNYRNPFKASNPYIIDNIKLFLKKSNIPIEILSNNFVSYSHPLKFKCNIHGEFEQPFKLFKRTWSCPKCGREKACKNKITNNYQQFELILNKLNLKLISQYVNSKIKVVVSDNEGYQYYITPYKMGQCELKPFHAKNPFAIKNIKLWLSKHRKGYELISNIFKGKDFYLKFKCDKGHIFSMKWTTMYHNDAKCNKCKIINLAERCRHEYDYVKLYIEKYGYKLLSEEYLNGAEKLKIKCPNGHIFMKSFNHFKRGQRCPECYGSGGELEISRVLDFYNIKYNREFDQHNLEQKFRYDFVIFDFDSDKILKFLIEYDGEQHFKPKNFGGVSHEEAKKKLAITHFNDRIKSEYCISNNIPLIRIPYWEYNNIETILEHVLGYFKLIDKQDVDEQLVHKFLVNHPDWSHEKYISQAI